MNRAPVHIALMVAMSLGLVAEARAITPGVSAHAAESATVLSPTYVQSQQYGSKKASSNNEMIPPSIALQAALRYAPGSQGLGVRLLPGSRLVYAVKLKSGNRIRRVLVDAHTGQVLGE